MLKTRRRAARSPVEQFHRVNDRQAGCTLRDLHQAADISGRHDVGLDLADVHDFRVTKLVSDFRLQDVVSPRRTAAQMCLRHVDNFESNFPQKLFWRFGDALS